MIPTAGPSYEQSNEARTRETLRQMDDQNHKRGRDLELARDRLIMTDEVTGFRFKVAIQSGAIVLVAL